MESVTRFLLAGFLILLLFFLCLAGCRNWGYPFWTICWSRLPAIHHTRLFRQVNPVHIQTYLSKTLVMVRAGGGGVLAEERALLSRTMTQQILEFPVSTVFFSLWFSPLKNALRNKRKVKRFLKYLLWIIFPDAFYLGLYSISGNEQLTC